MWDIHSELESLDIQVKIISFDNDFMAESYLKNSHIDWPLLVDEDLKTYRDYGLQKASWWTLYNPLSILKYLKLIFTGTTPGKPGKDLNQLGGDVLVDPQGVVKFHYVSQSPHDRPAIESMLNKVRQI